MMRWLVMLLVLVAPAFAADRPEIPLLTDPRVILSGVGEDIVFSTIPLTITVTPHGVGLQDAGTSSIQFVVVCHYPSGPDDDCTNAGGATWVSHDSYAGNVTSGGLFTWTGAVTDPPYTNGTWQAQAAVSASVAGTCNGSSVSCFDYATVTGQHAGDSWQIYITPATTLFKDPASGSLLPITLTVGYTAAIGAGRTLNSGGQGQPTYTCNMASSNSGVLSITRDGFATGVSPGTATVTCNQQGDAVTSGGVTTLSVTVVAVSVVTPVHWWIRPDGGTPHSATNTAGQCDGVHDAAYPGTGTNQACAFGDFKDMYFDGVTPGFQAWLPGQRDIVTVRNPTSGHPYHIAVVDVATFNPPNCRPDITDCQILPMPSGLTIRGENYLTCDGDHGPNSTAAVINGYGTDGLNVQLSQGVDIECLEIQQQGPSVGNNLRYGIHSSAFTAGSTFNNLFLHGHKQITFGSFGVGNTFDHFHARAGSGFGMNTDDAPYTFSNISWVGGLNIQHSLIEFTGCSENFPASGTYPYPSGGCNDTNTDSSSAQDGIGTANCGGDWVVNDTIIQFNFQDGLDLLHCHGHSLTVTNSIFRGNDGQQAKLGLFDSLTFLQNKVTGDCNRVVLPFGGVTIANLTHVPPVSPCRAGGAPFGVNPLGGLDLINSNTFLGIGNPITLFSCGYGWTDCSSFGFPTFQDNIVLGYQGVDAIYNNGNQAEACEPTCSGSWKTFDHNTFNNVHNIGTPGSGDLTSDPLLAGEAAFPVLTPVDNTDIPTAFDDYDASLTSSSPPKNAGVTYAGMLSPSGNGTAWGSPPSMGYAELAGTATVATPVFTPGAGTYVGTQTVTITTSTAGASIVYTNDGSTPTVSGTTCTITHGTLYTGAITVATTQTLTAIGCLAGDNPSIAAPAAYGIVAPSASTLRSGGGVIFGRVNVAK